MPEGEAGLLVRVTLAVRGTPPLAPQSARKIALSLEQFLGSGAIDFVTPVLPRKAPKGEGPSRSRLSP